jgi:FtsP/CotA-like multicopper oxidase with cupredoxin domain
MENMQWLINGKRFEMEEVEASEVVAFNSLEVWEFVNQQGVEGMGGMGGGMSGMQHNHQGASTGNMGMQGMMNDFMAHPMHVHGVQFQVIERQIHPAYADGWATLKDGFVDEGWKDTVLVMPGERVKILARFYEYRGRYLVHCHNLEHESTGMMRNFLVA